MAQAAGLRHASVHPRSGGANRPPRNTAGARSAKAAAALDYGWHSAPRDEPA